MTDSRKLIIIGGGPAGYAAGIYAARAQLEPLILAGEKSGGQLMLTTEVENYPGFIDGIMGPELMTIMRQQAERFGAKIIDHDGLKADLTARPFRVWSGHHQHGASEGHVHLEHVHGEGEHTAEDHQQAEEFKHEDALTAEAVIITTGAESVTLGVPGEADYIGRGVSYCAVCDAAFFRDKRVFVVGGGDAAMEDTLALIKFAKKITVVHRREAFRASKIMQDRVLKSTDKVDVVWNSEVTKVLGNGQQITGIGIKNNQTGEESEVPAEGLFVAIGHKPATGFLKNSGVELDEKGYVVTGMTYPFNDKFKMPDNNHLWREGYPTMTSVEGVFAAGDNVDFRYKQAVTAAGLGVMAALDAEKWLESR